MTYIRELRSLVGHRPIILVGAIVMIFDDNHHLLLHHRTDDNTWDFPGGYMELGETIEETARREVLEEVGLEIGEMTLFKVFSGKEFYYECPNGDQVFPVNPVYVTRDVRGALQPDRVESSEARYFPLDDLPEEMFPQVQEIIDCYLKSKDP